LCIEKIGTVEKSKKNGHRTFTNYATEYHPVLTKQSRQNG
jgi:hypothetical protein